MLMTTENIVVQGGVVIYNPTAGRGQGAILVEQAKMHLGDSFEWVPTLRVGHASELAKSYAGKVPTIVACGGDGTVGDVARGIYGTDTNLGVIPVGTGNDFARNLGLPLNVEEACLAIMGGTIRYVDVGEINGSIFINNAGVGFDSHVMKTMNSGIRFLRGRPAFMLAILKSIFVYKPFHLTVQTEDVNLDIPKALLVSVLNGQVYAAGLPAAPGAEVDDGRMDVLILDNVHPIKRLGLLMMLQRGSHVQHPGIRLFQARSIKINAVPPQQINIDGEVRGSTPIIIDVKARTLRVLIR
jgi:YegS/Rv2252/BmrU family lipid kinase